MANRQDLGLPEADEIRNALYVLKRLLRQSPADPRLMPLLAELMGFGAVSWTVREGRVPIVRFEITVECVKDGGGT